MRPPLRWRRTTTGRPRPSTRLRWSSRSAFGALGHDVLIDAEEVRRVVLPLERTKPLVLRRAVGRAHAVLPLLAQKIYVDAAGGMWAYSLPKVPDPRDARSGGRSVGPHAIDRHCVRRA